jgi:hypothetical protein
MGVRERESRKNIALKAHIYSRNKQEKKLIKEAEKVKSCQRRIRFLKFYFKKTVNIVCLSHGCQRVVFRQYKEEVRLRYWNLNIICKIFEVMNDKTN